MRRAFRSTQDRRNGGGLAFAGRAAWERIDSGTDLAITSDRVGAYLNAHPDTTAYFDTGFWCAGVARSLQDRGVAPGKVLLGGFDLVPEVLQQMQKGYVQALVDQQPYMQGFMCSPGSARTAGWVPCLEFLEPALKRLFKTYLEKPELAGLILLVLLVVIFEIRSNGVFLNQDNLRGILGILPETGLVAIGVTILMISGEFDLSVGSVFALMPMCMWWMLITAAA